MYLVCLEGSVAVCERLAAEYRIVGTRDLDARLMLTCEVCNVCFFVCFFVVVLFVFSFCQIAV